ncbi:hypothetical protein [Phocaeicola barnesiae]|uniref:hypothetical protein n=1 Tax=Phocaeicola barnesiae TaxID=376804 RepID=UPI0039C96621
MICLNRKKILVEIVDNTGTYVRFIFKLKVIAILPRLHQTYLFAGTYNTGNGGRNKLRYKRIVVPLPVRDIHGKYKCRHGTLISIRRSPNLCISIHHIFCKNFIHQYSTLFIKRILSIRTSDVICHLIMLVNCRRDRKDVYLCILRIVKQYPDAFYFLWNIIQTDL